VAKLIYYAKLPLKNLIFKKYIKKVFLHIQNRQKSMFLLRIQKRQKNHGFAPDSKQAKNHV
jgi:hypothetical protein